MTTLLISKIGTRLASVSLRLIVIATLGQLAGCASLLSDGAASFSCPADAQGVTCMSPREVYGLTHNRDSISNSQLNRGGTGITGRSATLEGTSGVTPRQIARGQLQGPGVNLDDLAALYRPQIAPGLAFTPILEAAQVQRTYVSPYVSPTGSLVAPGKVFTEVTPRRWRVGESMIKGSSVAAPLRAIQQEQRPDATQGGPILSTTRQGTDVDQPALSGSSSEPKVPAQ